MTETYLLNLAYVLYVASAMIKTVVRLRAMLIVASIVFMSWAAVAGIWSAFVWNLLFGSVHAFQLVKLWRQHRTIAVSETEASLHRRRFSELDRLEFFTLWSVGHGWRWPHGSTLIRQGQEQTSVLLVIDGSVRIERDGFHVASLGPGSFLGEHGYLTNGPARATVRAAGDVATHEWQRSTIDTLGDICPPAHGVLIRQLGVDAALKLG